VKREAAEASLEANPVVALAPTEGEGVSPFLVKVLLSTILADLTAENEKLLAEFYKSSQVVGLNFRSFTWVDGD
jgi:hypothetical protein